MREETRSFFVARVPSLVCAPFLTVSLALKQLNAENHAVLISTRTFFTRLQAELLKWRHIKKLHVPRWKLDRLDACWLVGWLVGSLSHNISVQRSVKSVECFISSRIMENDFLGGEQLDKNLPNSKRIVFIVLRLYDFPSTVLASR